MENSAQNNEDYKQQAATKETGTWRTCPNSWCGRCSKHQFRHYRLSTHPHTILETNMHPLKPLGKMENSSKHLNRNPMRRSCCGLPGTSSKAMGNQSKKIKSMLNSTTPSFLITPSFLTRLKRHRVAWASCQMPVIVQDSQQREREWERDNCFSNRSSPSCLPCIRNLPTAQKAKSCIGPLPWICSECNLVCFFCNWGGPMQNSDPANLGGYMNAWQQEKGRCSN